MAIDYELILAADVEPDRLLGFVEDALGLASATRTSTRQSGRPPSAAALKASTSWLGGRPT